jgi:hypothetical protein
VKQGTTKTKEAITRYISSSHFQFNSIVRSRESGIFCPVLFYIQVDLGRSVCVRTYEFILKQNWQLHWGIDCFLVSLVSLDLIA